jgi:3-hydroxybutyrate dehydrogenase
VKSMHGQHALVTGANRGIGAAIARHLAQAGADVSLLVRTPANAAPLAAELQAMGVRTTVVGADVTDSPALRAAIGDAEDTLGPIHALVNNAGTAETVPFLKSDDALFARMIGVHLMAPVHAIQSVLPGMIARGGGRIVNVASIAGLGGGPYITAYTSAKHAEMGLTRALAVEFRAKGIRINAVCPGYVDTEMVSGAIDRLVRKTGLDAAQALATIIRDSGQKRLATVDEVAAAVLAYALPSCDVTGEHTTVMGELA